MTDNPYTQWMLVENDVCSPLIDKKVIDGIQEQVFTRVLAAMGDGPHPSINLDLEHLQIADYRAFGGVTEQHRQLMSDLHGREPIRPEEMIFLALRSLFQYAWPLPTNEHEILFAATTETALNQTLIQLSLDLANKFSSPEALLPYWGRLVFLRVMSQLPAENVERFGLDRVAFTLVKKAKFNATTFALHNGALVSMNYALEPILKHFNRFLLHYFCTQDYAGPKRLSRAWGAIVPTVLHFWSNVPANEIARSPTAAYQQDMALMAHRLTSDQLDFIMMHELGHVALDHPLRLRSEIATGRDVTMVRHEFELAADAFALGLMRSKLVKTVRARTEAPQSAADEATVTQRMLDALHDYQTGLGAVYLLFCYMDFVQRAGEMLRKRLGNQIEINERMDTHPRASARLERLELVNLAEYLYTSPVQRYAQAFLNSVLSYAEALDDETLLTSLTVPIT